MNGILAIDQGTTSSRAIIFSSKGKITNKNVTKYISHMIPCIEVVCSEEYFR